MASCFYRSGEFCDLLEGEIFTGSDGKCDCRDKEEICTSFLNEEEIDRMWEAEERPFDEVK
jgi:hypothetical protein